MLSVWVALFFENPDGFVASFIFAQLLEEAGLIATWLRAGAELCF